MKNRKSIGLLARLDNSGLGTLCWEFLKHVQFDQVKLISNGRYKVYKDRGYNFVDTLTTDVVLSFETFYGERKKNRQKFILVPMYECTHPGEIKIADKIVNPSLLDQKYYPHGEFIPIPVNRTVLPYRERSKASIFVHNAGHGGLGGRNGTKELTGAFKGLSGDFKLIIKSQIPIICDNPLIEVQVRDYDNYYDIWGEGDVFIFPEKFNGLSLPIQEAIACGMPIMCSNRYPFNAYLPRELMIPVSGYKKERIAVDFDMAVIEPESIRETALAWAGKDISHISQSMNNLAHQLSWESLHDRWNTILTG
jgi:glycosyltransferase involved in cell wall biosynthesis